MWWTIRKGAIRLGTALLVLLAVFTVTFVMMRMAPGSPFARMNGLSPAVTRNLAVHFGHNKPLVEQYVVVLGRTIKGDLGPSVAFSPGEPVTRILGRSLPVSLKLGLLALLIALALGVPLGIVTGLSPGRKFDRVVSSATLIVMSASVIVLGALFRKWFIVDLGWFRLGGFDSLSSGFLPCLTLGLAYAVIFLRLVRGNVRGLVGRRNLSAVAGRGVPGNISMLKYVAPGALIPMLAYMGPAVAAILTGSFVVETLFEVPGVSACFIEGAAARDYPLVSGAILSYTAILLSANFAFETLHSILDPRERQHGGVP